MVYKVCNFSAYNEERNTCYMLSEQRPQILLDMLAVIGQEQSTYLIKLLATGVSVPPRKIRQRYTA